MEERELELSRAIFPDWLISQVSANFAQQLAVRLVSSDDTTLRVRVVSTEPGQETGNTEIFYKALTDAVMDMAASVGAPPPARSEPARLDLTLRVQTNPNGVKVTVAANPAVHPPLDLLRRLARHRTWAHIRIESPNPIDLVVISIQIGPTDNRMTLLTKLLADLLD